MSLDLLLLYCCDTFYYSINSSWLFCFLCYSLRIYGGTQHQRYQVYDEVREAFLAFYTHVRAICISSAQTIGQQRWSKVPLPVADVFRLIPAISHWWCCCRSAIPLLFPYHYFQLTRVNFLAFSYRSQMDGAGEHLRLMDGIRDGCSRSERQLHL